MGFRKLLISTILIATQLFNFVQSSHAGEKKEQKQTIVNLTGKKITKETLTFKHPELIKTLILDSCNLLFLPKEVAELSHLEHLSIRYNPNINMGQVLLELKHSSQLEFLDLSNNFLETIPNAITQLKNLKGLRLSHNKIAIERTTLVLKELPELLRLWIDNNALSIFPPSLFTLPKLRFLYAYNNRIAQLNLPETQSGKLWVLHLGDNHFNELPLELIKIEHLRMVHFNNNRISRISDKFKTEKYSFNALILDGNLLNEAEIRKADKIFGKFMMYSPDRID